MLFLIVIYIFFCLLIWHQLRITYRYKKKCINDIESINSRFFLFLFLILSNFFRLIFFLYIYFFYYYDYVLIIDLDKPTFDNFKITDFYSRIDLNNNDIVNNSFINNIHKNNSLLKFLKKENDINIEKVEKEKLNLLSDVGKEKKEIFNLVLNEKQKMNNSDKSYKKNNNYNLLRKIPNIQINDFNQALDENEIDQMVGIYINDMYNKNVFKEKPNLGNEYVLFKNKDINKDETKKEKLYIKNISTDTSKKKENNLNETSYNQPLENESFQYNNSFVENKNMKNSFLKYPNSRKMGKLTINTFKVSGEKKNDKIINSESSTLNDLKTNEDNATNEALNKKYYIMNINKNENYPEKNKVEDFSEYVHSTEKSDIYVNDNITKENNNKILNNEENNDIKKLKNKVSDNIKELKEENTNKNITSAYSINLTEENENNKSKYENHILTNTKKKNRAYPDKNELLIRIYKSNEKNLLLWIYLFLNFLPSLFYVSAYSIILSLIIKVYYIFVLKSSTVFKQALFYGNVLLYFLFISITCFTFVTSIYLYKAYVLILLTIYYIILAILLCYFGNKLLIHLNLRNKYYGIKEIDTYIIPLRHKKDNLKKSRKYKLKTTNSIKNYFYKIRDKLFNRRIHTNTRKDLKLNIFILVSFISFILVLNGFFNVYMAYRIIRTYMNYNYIKKIHIYLYIYLISEFIPNICIFLTYWTKKIDNKSYFSNNNVNLLCHLNNTINKNITVYEKNYNKNIKHLYNDNNNTDVYEEFY
ncbi:hypothetical protein PRELSG_0605900 [Plasmodium relictum]|uniref:Uncharacterized protein n=1 Tax=Plasmodium relictum TaxID=85471 RepID=A0A1J1H2K7_PLARL|nr:hypothetical protein PRELSG_0605900 [Plasmodium relictum]CRG99084.1 hypothetical protein PRELSG_0605900 [Plasmodium relictum]